MAFSEDDKKVLVAGGYELKLVEEDKDLECSICLQLLKDAMGTPCSHVFCRVCIQKIISQGEVGKTTFKCPDCQQQVDTDKVYPNAFVDRLVRRSIIYCSRNDKGCQWTGTLASFQQHRSECNHRVVQCIYEGCFYSGIRLKIKDHESKCEHRMSQCEHCKAEMRIILLEEHYKSCESIPTCCPQDKCDVIVPKIELQKHLDQNCMFRIVNCPFAKFGCSEKVSRKDLDQHNDQSMKQHMVLMCEQLSQAQSKNQALQNEVAQLKWANNEIPNLRNEIKELREDLFIFNRYCPNFQIDKLLLRGVERWVMKNESIVIEESYSEWCEKISLGTEKNKLYQFDSFMLVRLKHIKEKSVFWSSNGKTEQDEACTAGEDIFYRGENRFLLRYGSTQVVIESETLDNFNGDNSKIFLLHPSDMEKITSKNGIKNDGYVGWEISEVSDDFCVNGFVIVCLVKI